MESMHFLLNMVILQPAMLVYQRVLLMAEILHQLIDSLSHYLQGSIHPRWLAGFQPSTVSHIFLQFRVSGVNLSTENTLIFAGQKGRR